MESHREQNLSQMDIWRSVGYSGQQEGIRSWPLRPCTGLTLTTPYSRLTLMANRTPMSRKLESRSAAKQGRD